MTTITQRRLFDDVRNRSDQVLKFYPEFLGYHPACLLMPMMDGATFDSLVRDIANNGLHDPVLRWNGMLLDGRMRLLACYECNQDIRVVDESPDVDPWAVVYSRNVLRAHSTTDEKAIFAARMDKSRLRHHNASGLES